MANPPPPDYNQINRIISEVTNDLKRTGRIGGLWKKLPSGRIERGEAYMNGSHTLILHCHPLMNPDDHVNSQAAYNAATDKWEKLHGGGVSFVKRFRIAIEFRDLAKEAFRAAKRASNRALDDSIVDGMGPPGGAPPATPEEPDGTELPAGASPGTPEEPDRPPSPDSSPDSHTTTTGSIVEWTQDIEITSPSEDADIRGGTDDVSESYSFIYDSGLATSGTSIASYKTEKTVNSRKSRYNERPRHKYADCDRFIPQGSVSMDVNDASIPETELMDEHDESLSSPPSPRPILPNPDHDPGPSHGTQPLDGPSAALPAASTSTVIQRPSPRPHIKAFDYSLRTPRQSSWATGARAGQTKLVA